MKTVPQLITAVLVLPWLIQGAKAQCMMDPSPPCQAYWEAAAVFTGSVTEVSYSPTFVRGEGEFRMNWRRRITRFRVDEGFKGVPAKEILLANLSAVCRMHQLHEL